MLVGTGARLQVLPEILEGLRENPEEAVKRFTEYSFDPKPERKRDYCD